MKRLCLPFAIAFSFSPAYAQSPAPRAYRSDPVDTAHGEREAILLWPAGAPGAVADEAQDKPKLTVYRAGAGANGAAAIVCPGGGYRTLASDHEGKQVAEWLNTLGVSAFVLQYRVGPRYLYPAPLQDAQRALRLAAPFTHRGSVVYLLGETPDPKLKEELSNERHVTSRTPPAFLFHTADDTSVPVENSLAFFAALRKEGVPGELHVFPRGRHGVGLARGDAALSAWPKLCATWLQSMGFLAKKETR